MDISISYSSYNCGSPKISVLLNLLNKDYNYNNLNRNISNIYTFKNTLHYANMKAL